MSSCFRFVRDIIAHLRSAETSHRKTKWIALSF